MKKFKYRLQALLKMKEHIEKERQKQLATSAKRVQDQEQLLEDVDEHRERTVDRQRERTKSRFSVAEMLVVSRFLHKLKRDTVLGKEMLKVLKKDEDEKRQDLLEATKERKKYEKLKEKQEDKHYEGIETFLAKESDETGINTHRQKTKSLRE